MLCTLFVIFKLILAFLYELVLSWQPLSNTLSSSITTSLSLRLTPLCQAIIDLLVPAVYNSISATVLLQDQEKVVLNQTSFSLSSTIGSILQFACTNHERFDNKYERIDYTHNIIPCNTGKSAKINRNSNILLFFPAKMGGST